jgi:hypothetical protein
MAPQTPHHAVIPALPIAGHPHRPLSIPALLIPPLLIPPLLIRHLLIRHLLIPPISHLRGESEG